MKIQLFLNKISHDHSLLLDDGMAATGWIHGMEKPTMNSLKPIAKLMEGPDSNEHLPHLGMRKEEWGSFLVHGPSASVYQLDHVATELFVRLKTGETLDEIKRSPGPFASSEIDEFCKLIEEHNLL